MKSITDRLCIALGIEPDDDLECSLIKCVEAVEALTSDKSPIEKIRAEMAELLDRILHDILSKGLVVEDDEGNLVRTHPSAAHLSVTMKRAAAYGNIPKPGTAAGDLLARGMEHGGLGYQGKRYPLDPVSTDAAEA